ncbi:MAG: hypothetical protein H7839_07990 [Magnetococcus sp. YQC-5]
MSAKAIQTLLSRLNAILDQLGSPETLSGEDVGRLVAEWEMEMGRLEAYTSRFPEGVTPGDGTREGMVRFVARIAEVQPILVQHKSEIADQLFSENRRVHALRRGYGVMTQASRMIDHTA